MSQRKTYEVIVTTTAKWFGEVDARSYAAARRLGEYQFNEGDFRQIEEEIVKISASEVQP